MPPFKDAARPMRRSAKLTWATCFAALVLAGCAQGHVNTVETYSGGGGLPRPDIVLVEDFVVNPADVQLDQGIRARLMRQLNDTSKPVLQARAAQQASLALTKTLVERLRSYGVNAEPASNYPDPGNGNVIVVQGRVLSQNEGNQTRRTVIGLGAGKSSMAVDSQVYYRIGATEPKLLQAFTANSDSGRAPGMAETMGAGAAAGRVATSAVVGVGMHSVSETRTAGDNDNADRVADALAPQIGKFFAGQGWIAPPQ